MRRDDIKKVQIACYVDEDLLARIDSQAIEQDVSRSALMAKALKDRFTPVKAQRAKSQNQPQAQA